MKNLGAVRVERDRLLDATSTLSDHERAEMAVPSYCHANPLIRWLFWQRLDHAVRLAALRPTDSVLDFGVGSGVLLPTLRDRAGRIAGTDLCIAPARAMAADLGISAELIELERFAEWARANAGMLDCVFALDVLEHLEEDELLRLSGQISSLLKPGGRFVVSGPTETLAYRIGRSLAGFRNEYHHRTIFDIDEILRRSWDAQGQDFVPMRPLPTGFLIARYVRPAS